MEVTALPSLFDYWNLKRVHYSLLIYAIRNEIREVVRSLTPLRSYL
jgi:hypothetical protein